MCISILPLELCQTVTSLLNESDGRSDQWRSNIKRSICDLSNLASTSQFWRSQCLSEIQKAKDCFTKHLLKEYLNLSEECLEIQVSDCSKKHLLLEALSRGLTGPYYYPFTAETALDIQDMLHLFPEVINHRAHLGMVSYPISPLHFACINPQISERLLSQIIKCGARRNECITFASGRSILLIEHLRKCMEHDNPERSQTIDRCFRMALNS
ncbi:MAG: hypothetical protein KAR79_00750 [Simkaniaceae bacterium]|nr:hypothetical protein [Simkaniaceae bacterium]